MLIRLSDLIIICLTLPKKTSLFVQDTSASVKVLPEIEHLLPLVLYQAIELPGGAYSSYR